MSNNSLNTASDSQENNIMITKEQAVKLISLKDSFNYMTYDEAMNDLED